MKLLTNLDLSRNEIKNVVIHNLPSHPSEQKEGQVYFNTSQNQHYAYRNGKWTVLGSDSIADIIGLQDALDSKGSIENEHNHKNKADLDSITDTRLSNWDVAYRDNHIHEHKAILDGIDEDRVTKWDNSVEEAKDYTDAQILEINGGAPSSSNSLKKISDTLDAHKESIDTLDALAKTKADDREMKVALDTKANKEDMNRELALKAVKTEVNNALSLKANAEETTNRLAQKADKTETEIALSHKVDNTYLSKNYYTGAITDDKLKNVETNVKAYVDELGETKASVSDVRALSLTKADDAEIKSILATKANLVEVNNELSAKADAETVNSELEKKALKSVVEQMNVDLSNAINTKMDIHVHPYKSENWYPTWNDVTDKPTIPTKTSQLTNDSNFLTEHQDISGKADKTELHNHSNKSVLDNITSTKITEWNNKSNLALGTTSSTAYRGDYGNVAYTHSQSAHAPSNAQKNSDITKAEIEAKLVGNVTSHTHSQYLTEHQDISNKLDKNLGAENVGKMLAVGSDGNIVLMDIPSGGDVIGTVDESNNILLSGNLTDGTYVLKYENVDGTYSDVGTLVIGTIEPKPEPEPFEGNLFDLETTKINTRFSSGGAEKDQNGVWLSDFIPFDINVHHTLYVKNAIMKRDVTSQPGPSVVFFDENKAYIGILYCTPALANYNNWAYKISDDYYKVVFNVSEIITSSYWKNTKYIKVSGVESEAGNFIVKNDIKDVIITLNTPIEDEGTQEPNPDSPTIIEGNLFNLDTVQLNTKISGTSGSISTQNGAWLTDLIAINITDISSLYVKNAMMRQDGTTAAPSPLLTFHDSNGTMLGCLRCNGAHASYQEYVEIISENYTKIDFTHTILTSSPWYSNVKYMRVNGVENPNGTSISSKNDIADVIIKINEGIE